MTREEFKDLVLKRLKNRYPFVYRTTWEEYGKVHIRTNGVSPSTCRFGPGWIESNSNHQIIIGTHDDLSHAKGTVVWQEWRPRKGDWWDERLDYHPFDHKYDPLPQPLYAELCAALQRDMILHQLADIH